VTLIFHIVLFDILLRFFYVCVFWVGGRPFAEGRILAATVLSGG
jgi:hypothetical protein